nr:hypothetical protein [Tanacetum cinerariifolium]
MEDQPLPINASPIAIIPGYIADSNSEEDEEDLEEDPTDYPADGGDNNDNESSDDDNDDDNVEKDEEDEEEEEHLALADPSAETMTTVNQGMSVEEIERVVGHIIQSYRTPATARNQRTHNCYECGSLRHYRSECPIAKFQKRVDMIHGGVRTSKPKNNKNQQQPNKRQNTGRVYNVGHGEKKHDGGSKPLCSECNYHHDGPCAPKCHKCNKVGHLAHDCRSSRNANTTNNQRGIRARHEATCYECGNQVHYRIDFPERKNQNHENQTGGTRARGVVHALGGGETKEDLNNIKDEIKA